MRQHFLYQSPVNHYLTFTGNLSNFIHLLHSKVLLIWYSGIRHNINICYVRKSMNPLTCYIELSPKAYFINQSLIWNIVTSILTIKDTWYIWQMLQVLKKESQYRNYHDAMKYVSIILSIKKNILWKTSIKYLKWSISFTKRYFQLHQWNVFSLGLSQILLFLRMPIREKSNVAVWEQ